MKEKMENVFKFYCQVHKLKNLLRSGWREWGFDAHRFESVAEHVFGTLMLAFAIASEFEVGVNVEKVCMMLMFHEIGETKIGDIPVISKKHKTKEKFELEAVKEICSCLEKGDEIVQIFEEFVQKQTKEAKFAFFVDKLECDLQCKFYDENNEFDLHKKHKKVQERWLERLNAFNTTSFSKAWICWDKENMKYDKLFCQLADYICDNKLFLDEEKEN